MTFRHRAGVSPYTSPFGFAETCVFVKQLPGPFHCGLLAQAPLLPQLRGHLAEFLNNLSLARLSIFSSSTCVGLRYGHLKYTHHFSRLTTSHTSLNRSLSPGSTNGRVMLFVSVMMLKSFGGYGMSTVCASVTPFGLTLAPANPGRTNLPPETLDFRPL